MSIMNNPVTRVGKMAVGMTVYFIVIFAATEAATAIYVRYSPDVKRVARRAYWTATDKVSDAKQTVKKKFGKK